MRSTSTSRPRLQPRLILSKMKSYRNFHPSFQLRVASFQILGTDLPNLVEIMDLLPSRWMFNLEMEGEENTFSRMSGYRRSCS